MSILDQVPELTSVNMLIAAVAVVVSLFLFIKLRVVKNIEFDVKELHAVSVITLVAICDTLSKLYMQIVKKGVGKPLPEAFDLINDELVKRYPGYVVNKKDRRWVLFNGGGAMGQMYVSCFTEQKTQHINA